MIKMAADIRDKGQEQKKKKALLEKLRGEVGEGEGGEVNIEEMQLKRR